MRLCGALTASPLPPHTACLSQRRGAFQPHSARVRTRATNAPASTQSAADPLSAWLFRHGGAVNGVQLTPLKEGRALVATQSHPAGKLVVSNPLACQVRYDRVTHPRLLQLFDKVPQGSNNQGAAWQYKQALTLLHHQRQGESDTLYEYLGYLPGGAQANGVGVPDVGMRLSPDVVDELQDPYIQQDIHNHKYWLPQFYEQELSSIHKYPDSPFGTQPVHIDEFGSAVAVVISRCFGLRATGTHTMPAYIDMADHSLDPNCEVITDKETGAVTLVTTKAVQQGERLCISYGRHNNSELLLSYGFVLPSNPHDVCLWGWDLEVLLGIIQALCPSDWLSLPLSPWQLDALVHLGLPFDAQSQLKNGLQGSEQGSAAEAPVAPIMRLGGPSVVDGRLLGALRVVLAPAERAGAIQGCSVEDLCNWQRVTPYEERVMTALSRVFLAIYQSFPTTLQEDRALQGSQHSGQHAMALTYRISMKEALERALQRTLARIHELESQAAALKS